MSTNSAGNNWAIILSSSNILTDCTIVIMGFILKDPNGTLVVLDQSTRPFQMVYSEIILSLWVFGVRKLEVLQTLVPVSKLVAILGHYVQLSKSIYYFQKVYFVLTHLKNISIQRYEVILIWETEYHLKNISLYTYLFVVQLYFTLVATRGQKRPRSVQKHLKNNASQPGL